MPPLPEPDGTLSDGLVSLRLSAERDIPEILIAHQDDREMHEALGLARPPSGAELGRADEAAAAERRAGRRLELTITEAGEDTCVGQVVVGRVDWDNLRAEVIVWVMAARRGRGYGAAALRLAGAWLLTASSLARLELLSDPGNLALQAAAEAGGFRREGMLRGYWAAPGGRGRRRQRHRRDAVVLSLVPEDLR